jgi:hypothetical protein
MAVPGVPSGNTACGIDTACQFSCVAGHRQTAVPDYVMPASRVKGDPGVPSGHTACAAAVGQAGIGRRYVMLCGHQTLVHSNKQQHTSIACTARIQTMHWSPPLTTVGETLRSCHGIWCAKASRCCVDLLRVCHKCSDTRDAHLAQCNVPLQHSRVAAPLVLCWAAKVHRACDVSGTTVILAARVDQQQRL